MQDFSEPARQPRYKAYGISSSRLSKTIRCAPAPPACGARRPGPRTL